MPVNVQRERRRLDALPGVEIQLERSLQLRLMLLVVGAQGCEHAGGKGSEALRVGPFIQQRIRAEIFVRRYVCRSEEAPPNRQGGRSRRLAASQCRCGLDGSDAAGNSQR